MCSNLTKKKGRPSQAIVNISSSVSRATSPSDRTKALASKTQPFWFLSRRRTKSGQLIRKPPCFRLSCTGHGGHATFGRLRPSGYPSLTWRHSAPTVASEWTMNRPHLPTSFLRSKVVYEARTALANNSLSDASLCTGHVPGSIELLLTFDGTDIFKHISRPVLEERTTIKEHGISTTMPRRLTWRLRRCGRVRMPYAAALLDQYMAVMSRQAFDLDFMLPLTTAELGDPN